MEYIVREEMTLKDFLSSNLSGKSKNNIKSLLRYGQIKINGKTVRQFDYALKIKDKIVIAKERDYEAKERQFDILFEDDEIIVVDKKHNMLTIATDTKFNVTLYMLVSEYVKKRNKHNKIFIIHRLDRDTSGIVMFAKNEEIKKAFQDNWNDNIIKRGYYAVVEGVLETKSGVITSYLKENSNYTVYSTKDKSGMEAITEYNVIKENNRASLLDINLKTGRKNQIRVHMSDINHPIIGDRKYGSNVFVLNRLGLHAYALELYHPITKKFMKFESKMPAKFNKAFINSKKEK